MTLQQEGGSMPVTLADDEQVTAAFEVARRSDTWH